MAEPQSIDEAEGEILKAKSPFRQGAPGCSMTAIAGVVDDLSASLDEHRGRSMAILYSNLETAQARLLAGLAPYFEDVEPCTSAGECSS